MNMETDLSLLNAARRMDQRALGVIFDRYAPDLYNYALRVCGDPLEADNIVGDIFSKLLEQLDAGKGPRTNLRSYLYTMTYHHIIDGMQLSQREAPLEFADFELNEGSKYYSMDSSLENKALLETLILAIIDHLTVNQRHVVVLRFVEDFSLLETAQIVGKKVNSVKAIQYRAIAKLRKVLDHTVNT
jgi:RNA polymerase sigma-70 factor (ECF subfamily)